MYTCTVQSPYKTSFCSDESLAVAVNLCPQVEYVYIVLADVYISSAKTGVHVYSTQKAGFAAADSCLALLDVDHLRELHLRQEVPHLPGPGLLTDVLSPVLAR